MKARDQLLEVIHEYNPLAVHKILNGRGFLRGSVTIPSYGRSVGPDQYVADPPKCRRSPYSTYDFYSYVVNDDPAWKDFPRRDQSHICSTGMHKTDLYGKPYDVYYVIPSGDPVIARCPADDMWHSFPDFKVLDDFNLQVAGKLQRHGIHPQSIKSYDDLIATSVIAPGCLQPKGFDTIRYSDFEESIIPGMGREVWFSHPCLFIGLERLRASGFDL